MNRTDVGLLIVLVGALAGAVFAALAETSLLRASKVRIQAQASGGDHRSRRLERLQARLPSVLNAVLLVALLTQIGAAGVAGILAQRWFGNIGVTVSSVVLTLVLFVYGEAIPKTFAVRHPERVGRRLARAIAVVEWTLRPVVRVLVWVADLQAPGRGVSTGPTITEQELKLLAHSAAREGEITDDDRKLIERAFLLGDRRADEIMVPRTEIVGVALTETTSAALEIALRAGHRRLPVYEGDLDQIAGFVRLKDLSGAPEGGLASSVRPGLFVPESKRVLELLWEMQRERVHMAIVVDEHGGTAGLITVEDVVAELFGDISDEAAVPSLVRDGEAWEVVGTLPVEELAGFFDEDDLVGDWNTAAGLTMGHAGTVLGVGDRVPIGGWEVAVIEMDGHRIARLRLTPLAGEAVPSGE